MSQKLIYGALIVAIVLAVSFLGYVPLRQQTSIITLTHPTPSQQNQPPKENNTSTHGAKAQQDNANWKTLTFDEYNFEISYPATSTQELVPVSVSSYDKTPLQPCNISDPTLFVKRMRCLANLLYMRGPAGDGEDATIIISVADKDPTSSLSQWATAPNPDLHLQDIPRGDIVNALAKAYVRGRELHAQAWNPRYSPPSDEIVTYDEKHEKGMIVSEFGAIVDGGGRLSYTTLLTENGLKYVYSIELALQFNEAAQKPNDYQYIELYKQLTAGFELRD